MYYPIAIEQGSTAHAYGVIVPDIPGCYSAGDTLEEAYTNAKQAIVFHLEGMIEDGEDIPTPKPISQHQHNPELNGMAFGMVEVDLTHLLGKSEKINITLPARLIRRIDAFVAANPEYKSRSGFLAKLAADKVLTL